MKETLPLETDRRFHLKVAKREVSCLSTPTLEYRGAYVLLYILAGEGLCQADSALYRFAPGDVLLIRPNEAHCCFGADHQSYTVFELILDASVFSPYRDAGALRSLLTLWDKDRKSVV